MFEKFDHKFKGKKNYNFFIIFVGLIFAAFLILPDDWKNITSFFLIVPAAFSIAHYSARNIDQQHRNKR